MNNQFKTALLLGVLTSIMLGIGVLLRGVTGLTIAFILALFMNFITYWYSSKIALFMYGAKEAPISAYPKLHNLVRDVATRSGLPKPKVYIIKSDASNAFATGRNPKHSYIAFTEGILNLLDEDELRGVIAHEISHIKNNDVLVATIAAVIAGVISYTAMMARFAAIFGGRNENNSNNLIELLVLAILAPLIALIIQLAISRNREYLADETGARILRNSNGLAGALSKLNSSSSKVRLNGSKAGASLFIVNPFSGQKFISLFSTHPQLSERIGRLRSMKF